LWFLDDEPRLGDLLASWVVSNAPLLSMQRLRNVAELFPPTAQDRVASIARLALERGKDFRWKPLTRRDVLALAERPGKALSVAVPLDRPPALMLRLRALLGVGMRADVIAFLVSANADFVTPDDIAAATTYNLAAVRRLLSQLADADGLQRESGSAHPRYSIKGSSLARVAASRPSRGPRWRYTAQVFAVVTEYLEWRRATRGRVVSPFAMEVKGDEIFNRYKRAFVDAGVVARHSTTSVGSEWPTRLVWLAEWMRATI
jgi:hypothetical protein